MKRLLVALALCLAVLGIAAPANARTVTTTAVTTSSCGPSTSDLPADANGCKFWTGVTVCVDGSGINGAYYRVATIAQAWNNAVGSSNVFALDYSDDCVADGYPPSRRFTVDGYYGAAGDTHCINQTLSNRTIGTGPNYYWWTNGAPALFINFNSLCASGQANRDKTVSKMIGMAMGLESLDSSGWASRVMNGNTGGVTMPDTNSGLTLYKIYAGYWGN